MAKCKNCDWNAPKGVKYCERCGELLVIEKPLSKPKKEIDQTIIENPISKIIEPKQTIIENPEIKKPIKFKDKWMFSFQQAKSPSERHDDKCFGWFIGIMIVAWIFCMIIDTM